MLVIGLALAGSAFYFLTRNAALEPPADLPPDTPAIGAPPSPGSAPAPVDDVAALQKAGCSQSVRDLGLYRRGTVPDDIRPRDILSAEVRYCLEAGILTKEETAGLDISQ
ncbi:hypothetical protein DUT91_05950 [Phyllobacterium salinisoli]|uniref:Uncharacterized protein n=1 Tax=Phyllobacterium salinisoli TaxID=1899321 RepID=A0A368K930_9HYPH|nr:hypothetical protein [Phyllobacterium salinisoli]RCS24983.1 hypothetical protein DUT91_05950 [Phyllobacterium salinisoli]